MKYYFLDVVGAEFVILAPIAIIFLLFLWGLVEGFIINLFAVNRFWRSVWHAIIVNLVSLVVGFVLIGLADETSFGKNIELSAEPRYLSGWIIYWVLSVIVEGLVLKALNRSIPWRKISAASVVMNLLTYGALYAYVYFN